MFFYKTKAYRFLYKAKHIQYTSMGLYNKPNNKKLYNPIAFYATL